MLIQHSERWRGPLAVMVAKFMLNVRPDDCVLPQLMYKSVVNICSYRPLRSVQTRLRRALCVSINKLATCISHFTTLQPLVKNPIHPFSVTSHSQSAEANPSCLWAKAEKHPQKVHQFITTNNHLHSHLQFAKLA